MQYDAAKIGTSLGALHAATRTFLVQIMNDEHRVWYCLQMSVPPDWTDFTEIIEAEQ